MWWLLPACAPGAADPDTGDTALPAAVSVEVAIPAGSFAMGCDTCDPDEAPAHAVSLSAFRIDSIEVTGRAWAACVEALACPSPDVVLPDPDMPVVGVRYDDAEDYCAWRGGRLPTEAEWERAARGPDAATWPWGEAEPDCDRVSSRVCDGGLTRVDAHPDGVSPEGVLGMVGNAWEWVSDLYDAKYYEEAPDTDPTGPTSSGLRVVRGIDAWSDPDALRPSNRTFAIPDASGPTVGFRCAMDAE